MEQYPCSQVYSWYFAFWIDLIENDIEFIKCINLLILGIKHYRTLDVHSTFSRTFLHLIYFIIYKFISFCSLFFCYKERSEGHDNMESATPSARVGILGWTRRICSSCYEGCQLPFATCQGIPFSSVIIAYNLTTDITWLWQILHIDFIYAAFPKLNWSQRLGFSPQPIHTHTIHTGLHHTYQ